MNKTKLLLNVFSLLMIILLSTLVSYWIVVNTADFESDIGWYVQLFFGDKNVYLFNLIPMAAWELVQLFKFVLLSSLIAFLLFAIKRYFIPKNHKEKR